MNGQNLLAAVNSMVFYLYGLNPGKMHTLKEKSGGETVEAVKKKDKDYALMLGMRMASLGRGWVGVGYHPSAHFQDWAQAVMEGVMLSGANLLDLGEISRPVFQFALSITGCRSGVYIGGAQPVMQTVGEQGLPLRRREESLLRLSPLPQRSDQPGRREKPSGMWELYCSRLAHLAGNRLNGSRCVLRCGDPLLQQQAREVLGGLGCQLLGGPLFWLNNSGERLSAFTSLGDIVPYPQLLDRACRLSFKQGRAVALPEGILPGIEKAGEVRRYSLRPSALTPDQSKARELAAQQLWERDGLMLAVLLLSHQHQGSLDLLQEQRMWHNNLKYKDFLGKS